MELNFFRRFTNLFHQLIISHDAHQHGAQVVLLVKIMLNFFFNLKKFKEPNFVKENEKLITNTLFINKENFESSKLMNYFI